jgi:hypothetical protein
MTAKNPSLAKKPKNVAKATTVGAASGGVGAALIAWGSHVVESKYGIPATLSSLLLGTAFAGLANWAAKLSPHE